MPRSMRGAGATACGGTFTPGPATGIGGEACRVVTGGNGGLDDGAPAEAGTAFAGARCAGFGDSARTTGGAGGAGARIADDPVTAGDGAVGKGDAAAG